MAAAENPTAPPPRLHVLPDASAMSELAASEIADGLVVAREERGTAHLALSGGTTPVRAYQLLAASGVDWAPVEIWFADERCVPPEDEESNYRLVEETLVRPTRELANGLAEAQVHRMEGELGPHLGAERYAQLLRARVAADGAGVPALDLVVLGIGPEGHIASLFPDSQALRESEALCLGVEDSPKPPPQRITLSLPVLCAARRCLLLASGEGKAAALGAALGAVSRAAPASLLPRERLTVLADEEAAARLTSRPS
jgi:6-phosphogluconolactonase